MAQKNVEIGKAGHDIKSRGLASLLSWERTQHREAVSKQMLKENCPNKLNSEKERVALSAAH